LEPGVGIICGCLITLRPTYSYHDRHRNSDIEPALEQNSLPSFISPRKLKKVKEIKDLPRENRHPQRKTDRHMNEKKETMSETYEEKSKTTALPEPPVPPNSKYSVYLKQPRGKSINPGRRGKLFNPTRSKERGSGFGLKLFDSSFGDSNNTNSSTSKSISTRSKKSRQSGSGHLKEKRLYDRYEQWASRLKDKPDNRKELGTPLPPERSQHQLTEHMPHNASRWTRKQYSKTSTTSHEQLLSPINTLQKSQPSRTTQAQRTVQIRPRPSGAVVQNVHPFESRQQVRSNAPRNIPSGASRARPQRSTNPKEPSLPLDVFGL
jgi:hypothetical protein